MRSKVKYLLIAVVLVGFALMSIPAIAGQTGGEKSSGRTDTEYLNRNPIREVIDNTPSLKEMQGKPARALSYTVDVLGNKVPTQTDDTWKR